MVMALSTPSSSAPPWARVNVDHADVCALVCAASAGVHGALVVPHAAESTRLALAFAVATAALTAAALAQALVPCREVAAGAAVLLLGVAAAYLLSRTTGIPGLTEHIEPFDALGTVVSLLEAAAAVVAVRQANPRRSR